MTTLYLCMILIGCLIGFGVGATVGPAGVESGMTFIVFAGMVSLVLNFVFDKIYPAIVADAGGELPRQKRSLRVVVFDAETNEPVSEVSSYDYMPEDRKTFLRRKWAKSQKREAKQQ
jgi:hypothetical protein